jgi:hypothetical protein
MAGIVSVDNAQHVGDEENQQYGSHPDASAATGAPAVMTVVTSTDAKNQQQNDDEYEHCRYSFSISEPSAIAGLTKAIPSSDALPKAQRRQ